MKAKRKLFVSLATLALIICCSMIFVDCNAEDGSNSTYKVAFKIDGRNYDIILVEEGQIVKQVQHQKMLQKVNATPNIF